jgi:hypothetical protein
MTSIDDDIDFVEHHYDPMSERVQTPYDLYSEMRKRCPVAHSDAHEENGFWIFSRYQDVLRAARDHETYSNAGGITLPAVGLVRPLIPLEYDPPLQTSYRGLLSPLFSPRQTARIEERLRAQTIGLIDAFIDRGSCDLVTEFCERQPTMALWQEPFLGDPIPVGDGDDDWVGAFQSWIHDLTHVPSKTVEAGQQIGGYLMALIEHRRQNPADDIPTLLLSATVEGRPLSEEEVFDYLFMLFAAGVETTAASLGAIFHFLGRNPDIRTRLATEPSLIPTACEELLRFLGPTQATRRTLKRAVDVDGHALREGDSVLLLWGSADRDEDEFDAPDRCILDRFPNRHLAFGAGTHRCLGSNLARLELRLSLEEFLRRIPDYEVTATDDELEWGVGTDRALQHLPITF